VDRWPRFYFHVDLKTKESTQLVSNLSDINLKSITNVLESLTIHWLEANNFRPKKPRSKRKQTVDTFEQSGQLSSDIVLPNKDQRSSKRVRPETVAHTAIPTMPFTDWSRIKSARPQMYDSIWKSKTPPSRQSTLGESTGQETSRKPNISATTINVEFVPVNQFGPSHDSSLGITETQESSQIQPTPVRDQDGETYIDWVDSKTNQRHRINARTGVVMPDETRRSASSHTPMARVTAAANSRLSSFGSPLVLARRKSSTPSTNRATVNSASTLPWLQGFLQTWENPIFQTQSEEAIPTAGFGGSVQDTLQSYDHHGHCAVADSFSHAGMTDTSRLSKSALAYAQVISQVDHKFILMKVPSLAGSKSQELNHARQLLVLVDQHAASERCILEELFTELCTPAQGTSLIKSNLGFTSSIMTESVNKPLHFQIPMQEETMFRAHAAHFATWGILYDIASHQSSQPRLNILTLPPCISSRLHTSPHLLIELLRSEIHTETSGNTHTITFSSKTNTKHTWLQHISSCPRGIISLLNSRACRSAIMFNDVLDRGQCQGLVDKVKETAFPFVCAHGRNSMVPLVYLDGEGEREQGEGEGGLGAKEERGGGFGMREERGESFGVAYRKWRNKAAGV
jgi:DNA mismatch repair protein MLH3